MSEIAPHPHGNLVHDKCGMFRQSQKGRILFFWLLCKVCGILVPQTIALVVEAQSLTTGPPRKSHENAEF